MRAVTDQAERVVIDPSGSLRVEGSALTSRLKPLAGRYELVLEMPGLVVLHGEHVPAERRARVLMAGEMISRMTVMEAMSIIAQANWRGDLHVIGIDHHRVLSFDQGALKGARSDSLDDRLGEVMFRNGLFPRSTLDQLLAEQKPQQRFGELCVERGVVDQAKLFEQLRKQAESIFFSAMLEAHGRYAFLLPPEGSVDDRPATFHLAIQGLLMEGVQRIDEMALFRDKIPHSELCPQPVSGAKEGKLDDNSRTVLERCDGVRTIEDIARLTGLGEFLTTKAVYHLLQSKMVTLRSAPKINPAQVRRLVGKFNDVMQDIFVAVATYGGLAQSRATIDAWIVGSGYEPYFGSGVDEFGMLDAEQVAVAVGNTASDRPLEDLHQALHELAAFALFSATTSLPRDQELSLARDVNARLKSIRIEG